MLPNRNVLAGSVQVLSPVTEADGALGLCDVLPGAPPATGAPPWAQLAYNAGARTNRWEFRWDRIEPKSGTWSFGASDLAVQSSQQFQLDVLGILIGTPGWAVAPGQKPGNGVPRGLGFKYDDPRNTWATYVRQTVSHYAGQVSYWEVWNEPDLQFFWGGTPDDYFQLLKIAFLVIQEVDPQAKVLIAGMVVPDLAFLTKVLKDAANDPSTVSNRGYFDVLAWHAYGPPRALYDNIGKLKVLLAVDGYAQKPIWVTEDGFPASNPKGPDRQGAYVLQTIAYGLAAGASKILVYRASDDTTPKSWGLMTAAGDPRAGYVSFQLTARYFANARTIVYAPTPDQERFVFYWPNRRLTLLWNHTVTGGSAVLPSDSRGGTLVDAAGATSPVSATNGEIRVRVPGAAYNSGVDPSGSVVGGPAVLVGQGLTPSALLPSTGYVGRVAGLQRRVVLVNSSNAATLAQVAATARPDERTLIQIPANAMRTIDLDLLSGPGYNGMYTVNSFSPVVAQGVSSTTVLPGTAPSNTWYLPVAPMSLSIGNPGAAATSVQIAAYGSHGVLRARIHLTVGAGSSADWQLPRDLQSKHLALEIHGDQPVVLPGAKSTASAATTWYAVKPNSANLSVFNPDSQVATQLEIRFIGSSSVKSEQVTIAAKHSFVLPSSGARAVVFSSTHPVVVGSANPISRTGPISAVSTTQTTVATAGKTTNVAVFNPTSQTVHVTLALVSGTHIKQTAETLAPDQVLSIHARALSDPARGVAVSGDAPVVAGAVS